MSDAEDFMRLMNEHPELGEPSGVFELAHTETKDTLYALVSDKVGPLEERSFMRSRNFQTPHDTRSFSLAVLRAGSERIGNKVASIGYIEGSVKTTVYILTAPDGLQLQKRVKTAQAQGRGELNVLSSLQDFSVQQIGFEAALRARVASNQAEIELGLDLVSEQEAQDLITYLSTAQPIL